MSIRETTDELLKHYSAHKEPLKQRTKRCPKCRVNIVVNDGRLAKHQGKFKEFVLGQKEPNIRWVDCVWSGQPVFPERKLRERKQLEFGF